MSLNSILATAPNTTSGYILKATGTSIGNSLIYDNGTNVGINRTTPEFTLDVNGDIALNRTNKLQFTGGVAGDRARSYLTGDGNNNIFVYGPSSNLIATFAYTGNVGIGENPTSSIGWARILTLNGNNAGDTAYILKKTGSAQEIALGTDGSACYHDVAGAANATNNVHIFRTGGTNSSYSVTERMRITSSGTISINGFGRTWDSSYRAIELGNGWGMMAHSTNSDGYVVSNAYYNGGWRIAAQTNVRPAILRVYDGLLLETGNTTASVGTIVATTNVFIVNISGNVTNLNNSYGGISDIKLKENIVDTTPKLNDLLKVKVRNYNLIGDDKKQIGVIAQELEEIFPGLIEEKNDTIKNENGENIETGEITKSVKYSVFVPMLIKAIQELNQKVTDQQQQINQLINK